jgi:hypothetical protein
VLNKFSGVVQRWRRVNKKGLRHSILYSDVFYSNRVITPFQSTIGKLAVGGMQNVSAATNHQRGGKG